MKNNDSYGLETIHKLLLEALDEFDRICRLKGIKYSLHGGALLGAERNGKLIPWDDDLDISMMRDEYEKLKAACEEIGSKFYLNEIDTWLPRFILKDKRKPRVFIDIFIWDYISEKRFSQFLKINMLRFMQGTLKRNINIKEYNVKEKILIILTYILGYPFSRSAKLRAFYYIEKKCFLGKKQYIHRSNDAFKGVSYIFDANFMKNYSSICLEGKKYMVTSRYREFLERSYGPDYLIPPDISERIPGHLMQREKFLDHPEN